MDNKLVLAKEILELEEELVLAKRHLKLVEDALYELRLHSLGLSEGCMVRSTKTGKIYKFAQMWYYAGPDDKSWIKGHPKRRDGQWATACTSLRGDWELAGAPDATQEEREKHDAASWVEDDQKDE